MIRPKTISEQLIFSTVRIEIELSNGKIGTGTGFFFNFKIEGEKIIPVIITNKHVVKDAIKGRFSLHEGEIIDSVVVPNGKFIPVELDNFEKRWISHPNEEVDLCAMFFQPLRVEAERQKKIIFNVNLDESLIPTEEFLLDLTAAEEILMIGYPIGLWDHINNLPIMRRGITATHPAIDFCGKSILVIDVACFPGSSGSPVMLVSEGFYATKKGTTIGNRATLLGVLFAGPQIDTYGDIKIEDIPTARKVISSTKIMINLGYVIKAKEIMQLGEILKKQAFSKDKNQVT